MAEDSEFIEHLPCPHCGSSDGNSLYSDGHTFCFACQTYTPADGEEGDTPKTSKRSKRMADLIQGEVQRLDKRGISEATCRKFGYRVGELNGKKCQVADYFNPDGTQVVAQKVRFPNKEFTVLGSMKEAGLFGQNLWRDQGKMIVVTEGEIDALTVSQLQDNKWPVVSVPNGAKGAKKSLQKHLDWLLGFETIVLFFDNDEPGRKAADECAPLFPPGRCKIARMAEFKDANEALQAGQGKLVIDAIWGAKTYRPDGIVNGDELWDEIAADDEVIETVPYPWTGLNDITLGARLGEMVVLTAGSGIGKSAICREIVYHILQVTDDKIGLLHLEESKKRTAKGLMGLALNKPIHLDLTPFSELSEEEKERRKYAYRQTVGSGRVFLYDHFGSTDIDNLLARIRYMAKGCDCKWIVLDHISIVVSGQDEGDERRLIDNVMTALRTLVQELNIGMFVVSHLRRPNGDKGHEQGAETSLNQLRGSHSIAQLADMVVGLERDQQGEQPDVTLVRILKNRFSGQTGIACHLKYSRDTGRLTECNPDFEDDTEEDDESPF